MRLRFAALAAAALLPACAYLTERGRDLADIPTATVEGVSAFGAARAGPLATGYNCVVGDHGPARGAGLINDAAPPAGNADPAAA